MKASANFLSVDENNKRSCNLLKLYSIYREPFDRIINQYQSKLLPAITPLDVWTRASEWKSHNYRRQWGTFVSKKARKIFWWQRLSSFFGTSRQSEATHVEAMTSANAFSLESFLKIFNYFDPALLYITIAHGVGKSFEFFLHKESFWQSVWNKYREIIGSKWELCEVKCKNFNLLNL